MAESLARNLGLVERLVAGNGPKVVNPEGPRHLIVLDFEATCWNKGKASPKAEIIEFSAVILDLCTENITAEFQQYVMPVENPKLSTFCTEFTGISQDIIDNGVPLKTCLMLYSKWLAKLEEDIGLKMTTRASSEIPSTIPVTWSDWDLGTCLPQECRRKQLIYPKHLTSWMDLRSVYTKHYQRKPNGLLDAVTSVGLKWKGKQHCGLDDARNTAHVARVMHKGGAAMVVTSSTQRI